MSSYLSARSMKITNWIIALLLTGGSFLIQGLDFALGVLIGGALAALNFQAMSYLLTNTLNRALRQEDDWQDAGRRAFFFVMVKYLGRFTLLGLAIFILLKFELVNVLGLILGLSTVVINLFWIVCKELYKNYSKEALAVNGTPNSVS